MYQILTRWCSIEFSRQFFRDQKYEDAMKSIEYLVKDYIKRAKHISDKEFQELKNSRGGTKVSTSLTQDNDEQDGGYTASGVGDYNFSDRVLPCEELECVWPPALQLYVDAAANLTQPLDAKVEELIKKVYDILKEPFGPKSPVQPKQMCACIIM